MSKIPFISQDAFDASLHYGCHYQGLVEDLGYVYWGKVFPRRPNPTYPNDRSIYFSKGTDFVGEPLHVPFVIPEEDILKQVEMPIQKIFDRFTCKNPDGTTTVTLFDGSEFVVGTEDSEINVHTGNEFYAGKMNQVITLEAHDRASGRSVTCKALAKDVLRVLGDGAGYASYIVGPLSYHMGKHMGEVRTFRALKTNDGLPLWGRQHYRGGAQSRAAASRAFRYGPIPGKVALPLSGALKLTGWTLGSVGIVYTYYQYKEGDISTQKMIGDIVFGVVGFMGPQGMGISLFYFLFISPGIDRPSIPSVPRGLDDISLPCDNTRVVTRPVIPPYFKQ